MIFDFSQIIGPEDSKQENFSALCNLILLELEPESKPVEGKGGDQGLDTYIGYFNGEVQAFQHKYFIDKIGPPQKKQIEKSLRTSIDKHNVLKWTLMIPIDLTPSAIKWFDKLKETYPTVQIDWWGKSKLQLLLSKNLHISYRFQPKPNIVNYFFKNTDSFTTENIIKLIKSSLQISNESQEQISVLNTTAKDFLDGYCLSILIWGTSNSKEAIYKKRCEIRDFLNKLGHTAEFSEEIYDLKKLSKSGLNLTIAEYIQTKSYDYIICLMSSPGSIGEVHDFAKSKHVAHKMTICISSEHESGYSAHGTLRIFEGNHGRLDWFKNPSDIEDCHLATRIINQIHKVQDAKQWEILKRKEYE
jgi:hypothetical protein